MKNRLRLRESLIYYTLQAKSLYKSSINLHPDKCFFHERLTQTLNNTVYFLQSSLKCLPETWIFFQFFIIIIFSEHKTDRITFYETHICCFGVGWCVGCVCVCGGRERGFVCFLIMLVILHLHLKGNRKNTGLGSQRHGFES